MLNKAGYLTSDNSSCYRGLVFECEVSRMRVISLPANETLVGAN